MVQPTIDDRAVSTPSSDVAVRSYKGGMLYYYRQPSGEIVFASAAKMDMATRREMGWKPLQEYGAFVGDPRVAERPFDHLFRRGGAKEMGIKQLLEEGWAYRDYYIEMEEGDPSTSKKVEFPQLAGVTIPQLEQCPHCDRKGSHDQIANHEEVQHQKDMAPVKMAKVLGQIFKGEGSDIMVDTEQPPLLPYICGQCMAGFTGHMALARHVKGEHPK